MAKNWEHAAGVLWPLLVEAAKNRNNPTYSDLAPVINTNPLSVGKGLGPILYYCMDNRLPPLTSIVISKTTGLPGDGFIAWDIDDIGTAHEMVFQHNWDIVENPFGGYGPTDTTESLAEEINNNPESSEDVYTRVRAK